jgi:hypothetical protein
MVLLDVFGLDADTLADALETMQANCERHSTLYPVNLHSVTTTTSWDVQEAGAEDDAL